MPKIVSNRIEPTVAVEVAGKGVVGAQRGPVARRLSERKPHERLLHVLKGGPRLWPTSRPSPAGNDTHRLRHLRRFVSIVARVPRPRRPRSFEESAIQR